MLRASGTDILLAAVLPSSGWGPLDRLLCDPTVKTIRLDVWSGLQAKRAGQWDQEGPPLTSIQVYDILRHLTGERPTAAKPILERTLALGWEVIAIFGAPCDGASVVLSCSQADEQQ